uniref:Uncharacterized protein n=1 Tax=Arundo donax TaxID=35708 RepID=A0A0A9A4A4_ARUDO
MSFCCACHNPLFFLYIRKCYSLQLKGKKACPYPT